MDTVNLEAVWSTHIGVLNLELHRAGCRGCGEPPLREPINQRSMGERGLGMVIFRIQTFQFSFLSNVGSK
jgi:hypothetical protein